MTTSMTTTLAAIEQGTAAQLGPFGLFTVANASGSDVLVEVLRSTILLGGWQDLHVLRRDAINSEDRQARVKEYTPSLGQLSVDRVYLADPAIGDIIELHHLEPMALRRAVRAGLRRCHVQVDLPLVDPATGANLPLGSPIDLTALTGQPDGGWSWMTEPMQVLDVVASDPVRGWSSVPVVGWRCWSHAGHVYLSVSPSGGITGVPSPGYLTALCRRTHFSLVNGADAPDGPDQDDDVLFVNLDLAIAAGAIEAWRTERPALEAVAAEARQATQAECATEFTRQAITHQPWLFVPGGAPGAGGRPDKIGPLFGMPGIPQTPLMALGPGVVINGPGVNGSP